MKHVYHNRRCVFCYVNEFTDDNTECRVRGTSPYASSSNSILNRVNEKAVTSLNPENSTTISIFAYDDGEEVAEILGAKHKGKWSLFADSVRSPYPFKFWAEDGKIMVESVVGVDFELKNA